jgi:hypothetical protein
MASPHTAVAKSEHSMQMQAKQAQYFALLIDGIGLYCLAARSNQPTLAFCKGSGRGDRRINDSSTDATGKQWSSRSLIGWSKRSPGPAR